jgi:predicted transcriptional regulator
MPTLTAHVHEDFLREIDEVASKLARSRAWVIKHALRRFLEQRAAQEKRWQETLEAIDAADRGDLVEAEEVFEWLDTWGKDAGAE